jgi:tetratricopeptide (TPR) repeat protein
MRHRLVQGAFVLVLAVTAAGCSSSYSALPASGQNLPGGFSGYQQAVETEYRAMTATLNQSIRTQEAVVANNPRYADGYVRLAGLFMRAGQSQAALAALRLACQAEPGRVKFWVVLAQAQQSVGLTAHSMKTYRHALKLNPADWIAWDGLGFDAVLMNQPHQAWIDAQRAMAVGGSDGPTWDLAGRVLLEQGDAADALTDFNRAQTVESNWWQPYYDAARADLALGMARGAVRNLARAARLDPTNGAVWQLNAALSRVERRTYGASHRHSSTR